MNVILSGAKNPAASKLMPFAKSERAGHFPNRLEFHAGGSSWMFRPARHDSAIDV
jgi:hypothetical protein